MFSPSASYWAVGQGFTVSVPEALVLSYALPGFVTEWEAEWQIIETKQLFSTFFFVCWQEIKVFSQRLSETAAFMHEGSSSHHLIIGCDSFH